MMDSVFLLFDWIVISYPCLVGSLHIFVDKIPGMTIDGEGNLEMNEEERQFTESISIIYRGDGDVEPPPTTFQVISSVMFFFKSKRSFILVFSRVYQNHGPGSALPELNNNVFFKNYRR